MKTMRNIRTPLIKLGKVRQQSRTPSRIATSSRQILDQIGFRAQRVVVKVKQSYNHASGTWREHGRYLERDTARYGDGFSVSDDKADMAKTLHRWQQRGDEKLHKIILSPEYAERIDLKDYSRELMSQMEHDLGRKLEWAAIIHKNTDNHHVHIALRGVDKAGDVLDIEQYLGSTLRERSREAMTKRLGPRMYHEILERREKELFANRLTDIDRALLWKSDENLIVKLSQTPISDWSRSKAREQERTRMAYLAELGLAERISSECWKLIPDIRDRLKQLSLREQLVREQVPGWEFVRTLRTSGVVRKQLELGESINGRIIGTDIRDPFGDRQFMLIEGTDGNTYHLNQPRGIEGGRAKTNEIVTITRRIAKLPNEKANDLVEREFTSVEIHKDWKKSLALDYEAVAATSRPRRSLEKTKRSGFVREWEEAVSERAETLRKAGIDPQRPNWKEELETRRFYEADKDAQLWNPRKYVNMETGAGQYQETGEQVVANALSANRFVIGEVVAVSEKRIVVRDIRGGAKIIALEDVGLHFPPNVGTMVSASAKTVPHLEIRPSDRRIAELVSGGLSFSEESLSDKEKKYVRARANTWVKWGILIQLDDGSYRAADDLASASREHLLNAMAGKLAVVRKSITEEVKRQPAWLRMLEQEALSVSAENFVTLDKLLQDLGPMRSNYMQSWLTRALRYREELWEKRGVLVDKDFEKNARAWIKVGIAPTVIREGERVTGKIIDISASDGQYFSVDCEDGKIRHFRVTESIRERIASSMLEAGDVVTLAGKSFALEKEGGRQVHFTSVRRYFDWKTSRELIKAAVENGSDAARAFEEDSFAREWQARLLETRQRLLAVLDHELVETRLCAGEELRGKIISLSIDDETMLLVKGKDKKLHLVFQSRAMREAVSRKELRVGDTVVLKGREFEIDDKKILYTDFSVWGCAKSRLREGENEHAFVQGAHLTELQIGEPISGKVREIKYRTHDSRLYYVMLIAPEGEAVYLRPSCGIARVVNEGLLQVGDQVTLSVREFSKDGRTFHYAEVQQHNIRERALREKEELFGRLLSQEIFRDRSILLDTPEGKVHLQISRAIKNQIKARSIREGDVIYLSSYVVLGGGSSDDKTITLSAVSIRHWKRSEEFDRFVVASLQRGETEQPLTPNRGSFTSEWQDAVRLRGKELLRAGVIAADNPQDHLQRLREREAQEERRRPPRIDDIRPHDLRDIARLESLFVQATEAGRLSRSEANVLNFVAAAVRACKSLGDPVRIFGDIVNNNDWKQIRQGDEDRARQMLINYRERVPDSFLKRVPERVRSDAEKQVETEIRETGSR